MAKQFALLAAALVAVLVLAGELARAATPAPVAPQDSNPWWSPDARELAFQREQRRFVATRVVPAGHGDEEAVAPGTARGWRPGGGSAVLVEDGSGSQIYSTVGTPVGLVGGSAATWSPGGDQVAFLRDDVLYVANADGAAPHVVTDGVRRPSWDRAGPVWSPDGKELAIATTVGLVVVGADGSSKHVVFSGANQSVNPSWSPDGSTIAFENNDGGHWVIWLVDPAGRSPRPLTPAGYDSRFPQWAPVGDRLAFISDRQYLPGGASPYQYALYVERPGERPLKVLDDVHPASPARWSPTAARLAAAAGQECRRWGIYVVASDVRRSRRVSNLCRFEGGPGSDLLSGTPYLDIIRGFGGDDRILAGAGNDRVEGNAGNDTIAAGQGDNAVFGGPGNDTITAGDGNDFVEGGPGRDRISAGAGRDRIEARDGFRDTIDCGPGRDTAEVDRLDVVRNCEIVLRP